MTELVVDVERLKHNTERAVSTGILVRAKTPAGTFVSTDIADLDKASLLVWLRSRGGANEWAENTVGMLLGHGALHG